VLERTHVVEINELISRRSDGVSLGHETVTYAGPGYSRFMSAYRNDPPSQALGSYNSNSNYQRSFIVFHSYIYSLSVQERTV
jgi:hypothetical protein